MYFLMRSGKTRINCLSLFIFTSHSNLFRNILLYRHSLGARHTHDDSMVVSCVYCISQHRTPHNIVSNYSLCIFQSQKSIHVVYKTHRKNMINARARVNYLKKAGPQSCLTAANVVEVSYYIFV